MTLQEALSHSMAAKQTDKMNRAVIVTQPFDQGPYWLHSFYDVPIKCESPSDAQAMAKQKAIIDDDGWEVV